MSSVSARYKAGAASADITPPVGIWQAGFERRDKPSDSIYHPLEAGALALSDGKHDFLLITADWVGFYERTHIFRESISRKTGVPETNIMLCGSHSHAGPSIAGLKILKRDGMGKPKRIILKKRLKKSRSALLKPAGAWSRRNSNRARRAATFPRPRRGRGAWEKM